MKKARFFGIEQKIGKLLYALMVSYHHEDYVSENNGDIVRVPADIWHKTALENNGKER